MQVVCISGKAGHGKDTFAALMAESVKKRGKTVLIAHFADLLKYICKTFFRWDGIKDPYGRSLLQYVGTDVIRAQSPDYWADFLAGILSMFHDEWDYVLIPDTRFPNEYELLKHHDLPTSLVRIERPDYISSLTSEQPYHSSETALDNYRYDFTITNTSLQMLEVQADELISTLEFREAKP